MVRTMTHGEYLLDNRASQAGARLSALSELFDPWTFQHLDGTGVRDGWRCWEIGPGGPSVTQWLAERVGPRGHVLATDLDLSWAVESPRPNVELRRHDVGRDPPPDAAFDLVHARLVLVHVIDRDRALQTMVRALRPGGVMLVEDADPQLQPLGSLEDAGPEQHLANKLRAGFRALLSERGVDLAYGRTLPRLLREAGMIEVGADAYFPIAMPACDLLEITTINQLRDALVSKGHATADEIDRHLAHVATGRLDLATSPLISAWGRRP
jgi:SAM-dependent methyltransferase